MADDFPHLVGPIAFASPPRTTIRYWATKFDISPDRLKAVIKRVGSSLTAVEQELGGANQAAEQSAVSNGVRRGHTCGPPKSSS